MSAVSELLYKLLSRLPPSIRDKGIVLRARNRLRHWEILRRTSPLTPSPVYREAIEKRELKVIFVSPIYNSFPVLAVSLIEQTYENWELLIVHEGPQDDIGEIGKSIIESDKRIRFIETDKRANDWGHTPRQLGLSK